jgi:hypothetical protein
VGFVFTLFLWLDKKKKNWLIISGLLLGLSALTRPVSVHLIWIIPLAGVVMNKPLLKHYALFALVAAVTISPWVIRNTITFDRPFLSTISEVNLLFHNATAIKAVHSEYTQKQIEYQYRDQLLGDLNFYETSSVSPFIDRARGESFSQIKEHPGTFLGIWIKGQVSFFLKPLRSYFYQQLKGDKGSVVFGMNSSFTDLFSSLGSLSIRELSLFLFQWTHLFLLYLGVLLLVIKKKLSLTWIVVSTIMILYFSSTAAFTEVDARFRVPALPLLALMSAAGWNLLISTREKI